MESHDLIVSTLLCSILILADVNFEAATVVSDLQVRVEVGKPEERFVTLRTGVALPTAVHSLVLLELLFVLERLPTDVARHICDVNSDLVLTQVARRHKGLVTFLASALLFR